MPLFSRGVVAHIVQVFVGQAAPVHLSPVPEELRQVHGGRQPGHAQVDVKVVRMEGIFETGGAILHGFRGQAQIRQGFGNFPGDGHPGGIVRRSPTVPVPAALRPPGEYYTRPGRDKPHGIILVFGCQGGAVKGLRGGAGQGHRLHQAPCKPLEPGSFRSMA